MTTERTSPDRAARDRAARPAAEPRDGARPAAASTDAYPFRMKDLCQLTGLSRQAIHFYVREGLLPPGRKSARNMAYYGPAHLERLQLIRRLQHERLLPLKAIKAILANSSGGFDDAQRRMLTELKSRLSASLGADRAIDTVDAAAVTERLEVEPDELERMAELGLLVLRDGPDGTRRIRADGVWVVELWSQIRALGFTEELGFSVEDLALYEDAVSSLFERETRLILERLAGRPPEQVAAMVERALPLVHTFFAHYHTTQVRDFFAALE